MLFFFLRGGRRLLAAVLKMPPERIGPAELLMAVLAAVQDRGIDVVRFIMSIAVVTASERGRTLGARIAVCRWRRGRAGA
jgi:hypothetical protein